jgi:hypothetical protein
VPVHKGYLFFPSSLKDKKWHTSLGYTLTGFPEEITEEVQLRVPAGDFHVLRQIYKGFYIDGRVNFQIVQNHFSLGPRWAYDITNRLSFSVGDDFAWWFGTLNIESFRTKANGWMNYPNISLGYRLKKELLLTLKEEAIFSLSYQTKVGDQKLDYSGNQFVGWATSIYLEQPFYGKNHLTLGFRGQYTKFYWQTWSLFATFNRYLFYPEIVVGFVL